ARPAPLPPEGPDLMAGIVLTLKAPPSERLDFSLVTPALLARGATNELSGQVIGTTRHALRLADVFTVRSGGGDGNMTIETGNAFVDGLGTAMTSGRLVIEGDAGDRTGAGMKGGRIDVRGGAGASVGAGQSGGLIHVAGSVGDGAGGLLPGKRFGMTGGTIVVDGSSGARTGEKMRRGTILVRGSTGALTGARMLGGTIVAEGGVGPDAGRLMRRGTIIASRANIPPSFADCGVHDLVILRIMCRDWTRELGPLAPRPFGPQVRRYAGDLATIGKGELLLPA
ncbi:MAG: formylmethanofuran dehydrogenase subunit C, partial [Hyphomicrobiaceae bacterium]|nr:formylmethanofuran dehydrogenase subunit C [Hyphomicrobiaceae bacterium]